MSPSDELWFRVLAGLLGGPALGSFITMLSYRLPRRLSIVAPPSHCPSCSTPLKPRDLVPVFSWLFAGGKCRYCGVSIGARYVLIELATALLTILAFAFIGFQPMLGAVLIGIVAGVTLVTIGIERKKN
jgi:leader peptidase (prepilin peptidase)/N-methyltransferase